MLKTELKVVSERDDKTSEFSLQNVGENTAFGALLDAVEEMKEDSSVKSVVLTISRGED